MNKLETFQDAVDFLNVLKDVATGKTDIKSVGEEIRQQFALTDDVIAKRNEALDTINQANSVKADIVAAQEALRADRAQYTADKDQLIAGNAALKTAQQKLADDTKAVADRESAADTREANQETERLRLKALGDDLKQQSDTLDERDQKITEREKRVDAIVSAGKG